MTNYNEVEVKNNMKVDVAGGDDKQPERKELQKIVSAEPVKVKKGLINRLITGIVGPEGIPGIGAYVNEEIIKPAVKNIIVDAVTSGINMIMYGDNKPRSGGGNYRGYGGHPQPYKPTTNYSGRYAPAAKPETVQPRIQGRYGVEEFAITDRYDAAHVLTTLTEAAERYGNVSVSDYYDLIGIPSQYTDNSYGWSAETLSRASILPVRGGYIIKFPPVEVI